MRKAVAGIQSIVTELGHLEPSMADELQKMLNHDVVLDTGTPIVYLGKLIEITDHTFVLEKADMHDCRDGHVQKEHYLAEANRDGVTVNRRKVVVMRAAVISASRLGDVVVDIDVN